MLTKEWFNLLKNTDLDKIVDVLRVEYREKFIYPKRENIFRAFELCSYEDVKIVILGQDPYHKIGQANGLAFSVNDGVKLPPTLKNIFKELETDLNIHNTSGNLESWAIQGVLLLNTALTVVEKFPNSHKKLWQNFTYELVKLLNSRQKRIIFILWGKNAFQFSELITQPHIILSANHPSPLSAHGFFGCKHFSMANKILGQESIDWKI